MGLLGLSGEPMSGKPRLDLGDRAADVGPSLTEAGLLEDRGSCARGPVTEALELPADCRGVAVPCWASSEPKSASSIPLQ